VWPRRLQVANQDGATSALGAGMVGALSRFDPNQEPFMSSHPMLVSAFGIAFAASACANHDPETTSTSANEVTVAVTDSLSAVAALTGPVATMQADGSRVTDRTYSDDPACVDLAWGGMNVTITFDGCTLRTTGLTIDGTLALAIKDSPFSLSMTLTQLTIGETTYDGTASVSLAPGAGAIAIDLQSTRAGEARSIVASGQIELAGGVFTIDGDAAVDTAKHDADVALDAIRYELRDCLPSGGTASYTDGVTGTSVVVEFLATTPTDGKVLVTYGGAPPAPMTLPCP
jgi:hypothetical protein